MGYDVYAKSILFRVRTIGKDSYLFGEGKAFKLNKVAEDIWNSIDGKKSTYDITNVIAVKYGKEEEDIMDDVAGFLNFAENILALNKKEK